MPAFEFAELIPIYPLHWLTILHYLLLIGAIAVLTTASDQAGLFFTFILAAFALMVALNLYSQLIQIDRLFIFLIRVMMFALPIVIAGMATIEEVRGMGIAMAALAFPILVMTFLTCWFRPPIGDPRVVGWCF